MSNTKHFGRMLREQRNHNGWTLEKTAELCNMSYKGYEEIELGDSDPKLSTVLSIAAAFDLDLGELNSCVPTISVS